MNWLYFLEDVEGKDVEGKHIIIHVQRGIYNYTVCLFVQEVQAKVYIVIAICGYLELWLVLLGLVS